MRKNVYTTTPFGDSLRSSSSRQIALLYLVKIHADDFLPHVGEFGIASPGYWQSPYLSPY
jgi:hypothetical protein